MIEPLSRTSGKRFRAASRAGALALAGFLPLLSGCGLGTVGIVLAAMSGGGGSTPEPPPVPEAPTVLFQEDFEAGLARWRLAGPVLPIAAAQGKTGFGLDPRGTATGNGEAVSRVAFPLDAGLSVKASLRVPLLGASNADLWFGVKNAGGPDGTPSLLAGFFLSGAQSQARMFVGGTSQGTWALPDTAWHVFEVWIRPDSRAEFYVDGGLLLVSADRADPLADSLPVTAGGRSIGADVRLDDVVVFGYRPVRDLLLGECFGTDLAAWTPGGSGTLPSIDPFLQGNPSPALNPGGDAVGGAYVTSVEDFLFAPKGLEIRGDLYVSALGVSGIQATFGLKDKASPTFDKTLAAVRMGNGGAGDSIEYFVNSAVLLSEALPAPGWHRFRIVVLPAPDGAVYTVQFHRDGRLLAVSAGALVPSQDGNPVLAGGRNASGMSRLDNLAVLSPPHVEAPRWTAMTDQGAGPAAAIRGHAAVWDRKRNRAVVLCGGVNAQKSQDFFELRVSGDSASWSRLQPSGSLPSARTVAAAAYSVQDDSVYLVMGTADPTGTSHFQDLWRLDFSTDPQGQWTRVAEAWGTAGPSARYGLAAAYDTRRRRILAACGRDAASVTLDAWAFPSGGTAWVPLGTPGAGSGRIHASAAYDEANDRLVVAGGSDAAGMGVKDAFWSIDLSVEPPIWSPMAPPGQEELVGALEGRYLFAAAADPARRRLYLYGGKDSGTEFKDLYDLDLAGGADGTVSRNLLSLGQLPSATSGATMVYDPVGKRLVLVGGLSAGATVSIGDLKE